MTGHKPRVCVDFDGVLNDYTGWKGEEELGELVPGARDFLIRLMQSGYEVVILTTRINYLVWEWLEMRDVSALVADVTNTKLPAFAYVDDRAVCHRGDFGETLAALDGFKAHWEPLPEPEDA